MNLFKNACFISCNFAMMRYLMSNAHGRQDGAEKALRHAELCIFYVAAVKGMKDTDLVRRFHEDAFKAVHKNTQKLTDNLDEEIGFPLESRPDYDELLPLFFEKFHALALEALNVEQPAIVGYQVQDERGNNWGERASFEILSQALAISDLKEARANSSGTWLMIAILDGDVEEPTFI